MLIVSLNYVTFAAMVQNRIICAEISHLSAPISIREKVAMDKSESQKALGELKQSIPEAFILSTCNRTAIYALAQNSQGIKDFYSRFGLLDQYINIYDDTALAVKNLMSTAAGMESQAIGEHQILGQIRSAYDWSSEVKAMGPFLDYLVRRSVHAGKRVRHETKIGQHSASVASVGYQVIKEEFLNIDDISILVFGTGNIANLISNLLERHQPKKLCFASKSKSRAQEFANTYGGQGLRVEEALEMIKDFDLVIGGTSAEITPLSSSQLKRSNISKKQLYVDLGVPRNFNPEMSSLKNIKLIDLDQLKDRTYDGLKKRAQELPKANDIVELEVNYYVNWFNKRAISPLISNYWHRLEKIKDDELKWLMPKLPDITEEQKQLISRFAHRLIRKISQPSFKNMQWMASSKHLKESPIETIKKVLDMPDIEVFVPKDKIFVGSRGSKLAMTQTQMMLDAIRTHNPGYEFEIKIIKTHGDEGDLDKKGAFTTRIQEALLSGEIDMAVHSLKDLPEGSVDGLHLAAVPEREDVRDVLISRERKGLYDLKPGAIVGTGSPRRAVQLKSLRSDIDVRFINGNVDTRIQKMNNGDYDAIVLAAAGMKRLGMIHKASQIFEIKDIIPAVNQGALGVEVRKDDELMSSLVECLNHDITSFCCEVERSFLNEIGGGCQKPYAAIAQAIDDKIQIIAMYSEDEAKAPISKKALVAPEEACKKAQELAQELIEEYNKA